MPVKQKWLIYGRKPVLEALEEGSGLEKIFLSKTVKGEYAATIRDFCNKKSIPLQYVPNEKLKRFTPGNHQGIVALKAVISYYQLEDIVPHVYENGEDPLLLILDGITDVRNFGAIARSAWCAGVHAIVLPYKGSALVTADAVKTSAGALQHIPVCRYPELTDAILFLKQNGISIMAATGHSDHLIYKEQFTKPVAIVMGSEDQGIQNDILKIADAEISIPVPGEFDSYNVSVATGIILYEAVRQRLSDKA
jgi:23S rRNA (guanosine2251-2'-O)-methyltransferase